MLDIDLISQNLQTKLRSNQQLLEMIVQKLGKTPPLPLLGKRQLRRHPRQLVGAALEFHGAGANSGLELGEIPLVFPRLSTKGLNGLPMVRNLPTVDVYLILKRTKHQRETAISARQIRVPLLSCLAHPIDVNAKWIGNPRAASDVPLPTPAPCRSIGKEYTVSTRDSEDRSRRRLEHGLRTAYAARGTAAPATRA